MKYKDCVAFLYESLPMYQKVGGAAYKEDLNNTLALLEALGNPHKDLKVIHVAGTNGKGSVSHTIASILQEAGYRVGLYTSPHLRSFRERIRINGKPISPYFVIQFVEEHKELFDKVKPSFFEMTVALAFHHFASKNVDYAIVETGMGGRLDSTNVVNPIMSIITNVSMDHMQFLGHSLAEIAREKAGIIKEGVPVIIGETNPETAPVFEAVAKEKHAPIIFADQMYQVVDPHVTIIRRRPCLIMDIHKEGQPHMNHLLSFLTGDYQQKNILPVMAAYDLMFDRSEMPIYTFKHGVQKVERTGIQGRWQILQNQPLCIADVGHNEAGIRMVTEQLKRVPRKELRIVFGVSEDKDLDSILPLLPKDAIYYFAKARVPRAMKAAELQQKAAGFGLQGKAYTSVKNAYRTAMKDASSHDVVFIGGSAFVVAEIV